MRLDHSTRDLIKREVALWLGNGAVVRLFGSRVDDSQRGGDIDLLIDVPDGVSDRVVMESRLAASLFIRLGGRKVDVLIRTPGGALLPIHEQALRQGVIL